MKLMLNRFSLIAFFFIEKKGGRFLLICSLILMVPLLLAVGFSLKIHENQPDSSLRLSIVGLFMFLYAAAYSPGAGVNTQR